MVEDLAPYFADFGVACTVNGVAARGVFNTAGELANGDTVTVAPSLLLPATVAASVGHAVVVSSTTYSVRQVLDAAPDGVLRRLVLARG